MLCEGGERVFERRIGLVFYGGGSCYGGKVFPEDRYSRLVTLVDMWSPCGWFGVRVDFRKFFWKSGCGSVRVEHVV